MTVGGGKLFHLFRSKVSPAAADTNTTTDDTGNNGIVQRLQQQQLLALVDVPTTQRLFDILQLRITGVENDAGHQRYFATLPGTNYEEELVQL